MSIIERLYTISRAERNHINEQKQYHTAPKARHRNFSEALCECRQALAEVKALAILEKRNIETHAAQAEAYELKAIKLLEKAEEGQLDPEQAESLAQQCMERKAANLIEAGEASKRRETLLTEIANITGKIENLESGTGRFSRRERLGDSTYATNIDHTYYMLQKAQKKADYEEALAKAYESISEAYQSTEIDQVLWELDVKAKVQAGLSKIKKGLTKD